MKNYIETLSALIKAKSKFKPTFQLLECPTFIVNAFKAKPATERKKSKPVWESSPEINAEPSVLKVFS